MKPILLDLFCKAGGAGMGYHRAGFRVIGVDHEPQKRYPFEFVQADALEFARDHGGDFDVIHASPPCQRYSAASKCNPGLAAQYPDLVPEVRMILASMGNLFVIENVAGSPLRRATVICGSFFNLKVRRHRLFETNFLISPTPWCRHRTQGQPISVVGTGGRRINRRAGDKGGSCNFPRSIHEASEAMGIDWMTRKELSQAIPPAYTEFLGHQLIRILERSR